MASEDAQGAQGQPDGGDVACPPCRGSGRVTSNLGASPREVECPWCEGSGRWLPGHHAQAARRAGREAEPGP